MSWGLRNRLDRVLPGIPKGTESVDFDIKSGADIPVEERSPDEVTRIEGVHFTIEDINVETPAFDLTPADLIDGIITEKGVATNPYQESLAEQRNAG